MGFMDERFKDDCFTDSSFANNRDLSTKMGFIIMLEDDTGRANVLHYSSYKSKRVVRSVLECEIYAFEDGFETAHMLRHDMEAMIGRRIPLTMVID